ITFERPYSSVREEIEAKERFSKIAAEVERDMSTSRRSMWTNIARFTRNISNKRPVGTSWFSKDGIHSIMGESSAQRTLRHYEESRKRSEKRVSKIYKDMQTRIRGKNKHGFHEEWQEDE